tara:strand:- start:22 stop:231 length:210 start_codon:yes stop_codon:yes gene_type:complete
MGKNKKQFNFLNESLFPATAVAKKTKSQVDDMGAGIIDVLTLPVNVARHLLSKKKKNKGHTDHRVKGPR